MSELEARLESWRAVRAWLGWQQKLADRTINGLEAELAAEAARRPPPPPPDWKPESLRTGSGPKALRVHLGDCTMSGGRPLGREEVRRRERQSVRRPSRCPRWRRRLRRGRAAIAGGQEAVGADAALPLVGGPGPVRALEGLDGTGEVAELGQDVRDVELVGRQ
ncbi:hypothetical protein ACWGAN_29855 [Streptomyces sp. NPDC054945]